MGFMQKLKPVMPSLRERKRYVAFEVLSSTRVQADSVAKALWHSVLGLVGELGAASMGLIVLTDLYNAKQRGIARVSHTGVDAFKASLAFITDIEGKPATVRSLATSGNITKAKDAIS